MHPRGVHSKPGLGFELLDDVSDTMPHICIYVGHLFVEGWLFEVFCLLSLSLTTGQIQAATRQTQAATGQIQAATGQIRAAMEILYFWL